MMSVEYNFAQSPCYFTTHPYGRYTFSMLESTKGSNILQFPTFITVYKNQPSMTIYTIDPANAGIYTINICVELDNLYYWGNRGDIFPSTSKMYSPDNPPADLIYKDCVKVTVTMEDMWPNQPTQNESYEELLVAKTNTPPVLPIKPKSFSIFAENDAVIKFETPFDAESNNVTMKLDVGRATSFAKFDPNFSTLLIERGKTNNSTAGSYPMTLTLKDDGSNDYSTNTAVYSFTVYVKCRPEPYLNTDANNKIDYNIPKVEEIYNCGYSVDPLPLIPSDIQIIDVTEKESPQSFIKNTEFIAITD